MTNLLAVGAIDYYRDVRMVISQLIVLMENSPFNLDLAILILWEESHGRWEDTKALMMRMMMKLWRFFLLFDIT